MEMNWNMTAQGKVNREIKDRLFRYVFGAMENRKYLLDLCNAMNNTNYTDETEIEVTTLEDVIYVQLKNDLSFILHGIMDLYEHQSSVNPNMPLRGLQYFAELYRAYVKKTEINVYGHSLIKIPTPRYTVFYNGKDEMPEVEKLRLSQAFEVPDESGEFEWTATVYNINYGHNTKLMEKCKPLMEYSQFIHLVRKYAKTMEEKDAVDKAVEDAKNWECLGAFLMKNRNEVNAVLLTEFNQENYESGLREEGREEGLREGQAIGEKIGEERGRAVGEKIGEERGRAVGEKIGEERGRAAGEKIGEERGRVEITVTLVKQGRLSPEEGADLLKIRLAEMNQLLAQ